MVIESDVVIDFANAKIAWGLSETDTPAVSTLDIRNLKIDILMGESAVANKTKVLVGLRRSLKFFVRGGKLCEAIDFNTHVKLFMVAKPPGTMDVWGPECRKEPLGTYTYNVWLNIEEPSEMVIVDMYGVTSLTSDDLTRTNAGKPTCIEFVKSEGGVLFIPHILGLDCQSHQAVVAQRIRREMWRRTRPGAHFSDYGNLELRQVGNGLVEVWLGESRLWAVDTRLPFDIIPDNDYFMSGSIEYVLEDRAARKRMVAFTLANLTK